MLAVSDTGCGMDEATQSNIFDPFFTTKEVGKGTGLGLSTVYGIVKQSGGNIWVYSEVGRGTTFKIYLPCVDSPVGESKVIAEDTFLPIGTETVLLVEDEEMVREMAKEILEGSGYQVLEAKHGPEALLVAARHHGQIHLMLSDVVMPQMSGRELAEQLAPLRKDMRVLYMSGYTDDAIVHHGVLDEGTAFIEKPFTPSALAYKVRETLNMAVTI
jgi:CheY-like chemotaxis protein